MKQICSHSFIYLKIAFFCSLNFECVDLTSFRNISYLLESSRSSRHIIIYIYLTAGRVLTELNDETWNILYIFLIQDVMASMNN